MATITTMGTSVEVGIPLRLSNLLDMQPELKELRANAIIQGIVIVANVHDAVRIRVKYIPKQEVTNVTPKHD